MQPLLVCSEVEDMKLKGGCDALGSALHPGVPTVLHVGQELAAAALEQDDTRVPSGQRRPFSTARLLQATPGW